MIYYIEPKNISIEYLRKLVAENPNVKFVSLVGVDLGNNRTDERIPINNFLDNFDNFMENGIQTDGSSVMLPEIAKIYDARVDIIPDKNVKWFIDYSDNYTNISEEPLGTILIPSFLYHNSKKIGSRAVLERAIEYTSKELKKLDKEIEESNITLAVEVEFWIYSPFMTKDEEGLFTSQSLKEQYWKRPLGDLRIAMEECIITFEKYGLRPEMAHKEVGGVGSVLKAPHSFYHMEQIEIDWEYDNPMQTCDNEWLAKNIITDIFYKYGLDVTFQAKPVPGVAGSGEHHHIGISVKKNGKNINLFSAKNKDRDFLSSYGYGALMGILKHYNAINLFITNSNDAFNRLTPGFEAPVSAVCSIGKSVSSPTRNRTVLLGLVRNQNSDASTRFELRSPNPSSNSYLLSAACMCAMIDGMKYSYDKNTEDLLKELSKSKKEKFPYLDQDRVFRFEKDIYEDFDFKQREKQFGQTPKTVYEMIHMFENTDKDFLFVDNIFTRDIINSCISLALDQWKTELKGRILPSHRKDIREIYQQLSPGLNELDKDRFRKLTDKIINLIKDDYGRKSLFTKLLEAIESSNHHSASDFQLEIKREINTIKELFHQYTDNLL